MRIAQSNRSRSSHPTMLRMTCNTEEFAHPQSVGTWESNKILVGFICVVNVTNDIFIIERFVQRLTSVRSSDTGTGG